MRTIAKCEAEPPDQDVDRADLYLFVVAPYCVEQLLPGENTFRMAKEVMQQPVLGGTEIHGPAIPAYAMRCRVHLDTAVRQCLGEQLRLRSTQ